MALEVELNIYRENLTNYITQGLAGKYAVIYLKDAGYLSSIQNTLDDALVWGYANAGLKPFLCKRIVAKETPIYANINLPIR